MILLQYCMVKNIALTALVFLVIGLSALLVVQNHSVKSKEVVKYKALESHVSLGTAVKSFGSHASFGYPGLKGFSCVAYVGRVVNHKPSDWYSGFCVANTQIKPVKAVGPVA